MSQLINLIAEGEHQSQDFKMRIEDARKIARTLVAFANTDGGRVLIGVKDNGSVSGVQPEEEFHMIEAAAEMYSQPPIAFTTQVWKVNNKAVLEIFIEASSARPHFAKDETGEWCAYQRQDDRNVKANGVLLKVWEFTRARTPVEFAYTNRVRRLFHLLQRNQDLTQRSISKLLRMGREQTELLLAQLVVWEVVEMNFTDTGCFFSLIHDEDDAMAHVNRRVNRDNHK
jgi:predicted HTH transcriptional regulator